MGFLDDLLAKRKSGGAEPSDLPLLFRALAELAPQEAGLRAEAERYGPLSVNFKVPGRAAAFVRVSGGSISAAPGLDPRADLSVEVPEDLAREMVVGDPSGVLWRGASTGTFRLDGNATKLMALIPLFDAVRHRFGEASLFGKV